MSSAARLAATFVAALALAVCAPDRGSAISYEPPAGTVYSGVFTSAGLDRLDSFLSLSRQPSVALFTYFSKYPADFSYPLRLARERPAELALTWQLFNMETGYDPAATAGSTGRIARGDIDAYILERAAELRRFERPVLLRINHEMNGDWYPWSVRGRDRRLRPDNGFAEYIGAWRRVVALFRGGTRAEIDARLSAAGLPGLAAPGGAFAPAANVAFVWCASDGGADDPHAYYPGDAWVDWVGFDIYSRGTEHPDGAAGAQTAFGAQISRRGQSIYDRYSGPASAGRKPLLIGEWGMWNEDDPEWMRGMFDWVEAHPKVKALLYFNRDASAAHELERFPAAAGVYADRIASPRYLKRQADVRDHGPAPGPAPAPGPGPAPADTVGPAIVLSSPSSGQVVSGRVTLMPAVTDPSGVDRVRFRVDGRLVDTDAPDAIRHDLETGGLTAGRHVVEIEATDRRGNVSRLAVTLVVRRDGAAAPPAPPSGAPGERADGAGRPLSGDSRSRSRAGAVALTPRQLLINQRIAQAAIRRVEALRARLAGRPAPKAAQRPRRGRVTLSLAQLRINDRIAREARRRVAALEARVADEPVARTDGGIPPIRMSAAQLRATQRIAQDALRRVADVAEALPPAAA